MLSAGGEIFQLTPTNEKTGIGYKSEITKASTSTSTEKAGTEVKYQSLVFHISTMSGGSYQPLWFICSGFEPFRPAEHLDVRRR